MATLDDLIKIDGVVAPGEFAADGKLIAYKSNMDMPPRDGGDVRSVLRYRVDDVQHAGWRFFAVDSNEVGAPAGLGLLRR